MCISEYGKQESTFLQTSNVMKKINKFSQKKLLKTKNLNKIMADMERLNTVLKEDIKKNKIEEFIKFDF